jgi:plasmid stabilization system protein ParE
MKPIRLSVEADQEFTAAKLWYERIDPLLAARFFEIVQEAIDDIRKFPEAWPPYDETYRHYPLKRFPYTLFYTDLGEYILLDAVAHQSRRPNYWQEGN